MVFPGHQSEVPFRHPDVLISNHPPQTRHLHIAGHGIQEIVQVSPAAEVVKDDAGEVELRIEPLEPLNQGGGASGHAPGVHNQKQGETEPLGHLGGGPGFAPPVIPVKKAHNPFNDGDVGTLGMPCEAFQIIIFREHPPVEIIAGPPG